MSTLASDIISTARGRQLLADALVWDNHGCMPLRPEDDRFLPQLQRYRQSGVNVVTLNVGFDGVPWQTNFAMLEAFRAWIKARPAEYLQIETVADIERARHSDRLGIAFDIEGGSALDSDLSRVETYYRLGVRWMLIAYNQDNALGGGCQDADRGLTEFGRQVLAEMERVGMVVCCSHTGARTSLEVLERATRPVIFSHSNPLGVWQHKRNISDAQIQACARTGGVVGINGIGAFLGKNDTSTETFVRHIDYVVQLVGPAHVGLALDYVFDSQELDDFLNANPHLFPPEEGYSGSIDMVEPERIPRIVDALLALGYSDEHLQMILGGNHLRVAQQVWKTSLPAPL
ncbi:dipeptidase [Steroidobacter sp.]|uniref:dipeptidase n=1 Tax=Steroidobacter sp. TaxID=1978227 RepID=UPI001A605EDB|nr:membrane dipeptidase [Steroidobacter sp.]MBL8266549.1 membrane dipeptidase [Steroidobacter sp.]